MQFYSENGTPFYVNLPSTILSKCLLNPVVSHKLERYPTETDGPVKSVKNNFNKIELKRSHFREIYQAARWNDDPMYFSPTALVNGSTIFIGDIITLSCNDQSVMGRVVKFFKTVSFILIIHCACYLVDTLYRHLLWNST